MSKQKVTKPKIEELIIDSVKEEHKKTALEFLEYLKSKKLIHGDDKIRYKGKRVGSFTITANNDWNLMVLTQYDEYLNESFSDESEEIKTFVKGQIGGYNGCGRCITGKCSCTSINIKNADKSFCEFAKKLITLRLDAILNERVPKCNYIKISDRGTMKKCAKCKVCNPACRKLKNF
jgi:hypothetical protein